MDTPRLAVSQAQVDKALQALGVTGDDLESVVIAPGEHLIQVNRRAPEGHTHTAGYTIEP